MPTQLQLRRGSNSDMSSFTGAEGELTVNTTNKSLHLHDGSTSGGIEFARADLSNSTASWTVSDGTNTSTIVVGTDTLTVNGTSNQIDVAVGTDSVTISTPDSGVTAASYGSSTAIPVVTVDAKGRVTAVSTASITAGAADTDELSEGSTNLYFTNARADARITAALIDEDNFSSNSATRLPSQQSVKAYVDAQILTKDNSDEIAEGSTNLYFTNARADARITNALKDEDNMASDSATHVPSQQSVKAYVDAQTTDETAEGSSNLYYTDARVSTRTDTILNHSNHTNVTVAKVGDELRLSAASSYGDSDVGSYLSSNGFATQTAIVAAITDSAPSTLDTLNELAAALGDDANFSATTATALGLRVSKTADTGAAIMPAGTTAQRPTPAAGHVRYNSDLEQIEAYTDAWVPLGGASTVNADTFTGNGSTTAYALSQTVSSEDNLLVFIEGVFQQQDAYSIATASGTTTLTFSAAPSNTNTILVYSFASNIQGSNLNIDTMTGDGSDVTLSLSIAPVNENNTQVFIDGVYQNKSGYSISGSTLTFSTAPPNGSAVEVMTMTQTEVNVPVDGTITSAKLSGDLTTPSDLTVTGALTVDTDTLVVDATNTRVGIGASTPRTLINAASATGAILTLESSDTTLTTNGVIGGIDFYSNDSSTNGAGAKVNIRAIGQNTSGTATALTFGTSSSGSATAVEAMRIDASGNVGIGTATPHGKLQFASDINTRKIVLYEGADNDYQFYGFGVEASTLVYSTYEPTDDHVFFSGASTTSRNELMRITGDGIVTTPYQPAFKAAWNSRAATGSGRFLSTNASDTVATGRDEFNTGNHFSTATGKFTAPVAGTYLLGFQAMRNANDGSALECRIKKNGATMWARAYQGAFDQSYQYWSIVTTTKCAAGDYFQVYIGPDTSIYADDTYFYGHLVG